MRPDLGIVTDSWPMRSTKLHSWDHNKRSKVDWVVPGHYPLPRKIIAKSLERLDSRDSPDRPGMVKVSTLERVVHRFDLVFGNETRGARSEQIADVIDHLKRHTQRRRGDAVLQEGLVEWEQTSRIYELYGVELTMFERIFFTVDVGDATSVLSKACSFFLMGMIFLSIVAWMISTLPDVGTVQPQGCTGLEVEQCKPEVKTVFKVIERICVYVFTAEYLIRVCTVHSVRFSLLNEDFLDALLTETMNYHRRSFSDSVRWVTSQVQVTYRPSRSRLLYADDQLHEAPHQVSMRLADRDGKIGTFVKYVLSPTNLIDLFAVLPYWIELVRGHEEDNSGIFLVLRVLRLTRVFRVFKLGKYSEIFALFVRVVNRSTAAFGLMLFFIVMGCCLFGTLIWFAESGTWYPEGHPRLIQLSIHGRGAYLRRDGSLDSDAYEESPFPSIVHSFWFVIVSITTVGYGDQGPTSLLGKLVGALTIMNGIIVLAMPIGVLGANFSKEYYAILEEQRRRLRTKQQLETITKVEQEQDDAVIASYGFELPSIATSDKIFCHLDGTTPDVAVYQINSARQRILMEAELIDQKWAQVLPPLVFPQLSRQLRQFMSDFFRCGERKPEGYHYSTRHKPTLSIARLADLDLLGARVYAVISSATSLDEVADFGLREAFLCRRQWASFSDKCWEFAADMCILKKSEKPPTMQELKARLTMGEFANSSNKPRPNGCSQEVGPFINSGTAWTTTPRGLANFDAQPGPKTDRQPHSTYHISSSTLPGTVNSELELEPVHSVSLDMMPTSGDVQSLEGVQDFRLSVSSTLSGTQHVSTLQ